MSFHEARNLELFEPDATAGLAHERRIWPSRRADDLARVNGRRVVGVAPGGVARDGAVPDLAAGLLGPFTLHVRGAPVLDWPACRAKSLFKYLLLHRARPMPRQTVLDSFWPDTEPEAARNSLHVAIHRLRRLLQAHGLVDDPVLCADGHVQLQPKLAVWLDTEHFEAALDAAERLSGAPAEAAIAAALKLVRGELIAVDRSEAWIEPWRHRYNDRHLHALQTLAAARLDAAEPLAAIEPARRMVAIDACNEEAHRLLMRCYGQLAQPARVERQYRACVQALRSALGVAPHADTTALYRALFDQARSA